MSLQNFFNDMVEILEDLSDQSFDVTASDVFSQGLFRCIDRLTNATHIKIVAETIIGSTRESKH